MAIVPEDRKAITLTRLLRRINHGDDPELLRREAHRLLPVVGPADIATAEQNLIHDGYSVQAVQLLSAMFMLMGMPDAEAANCSRRLPANHLLRFVMAEHEVIRCFLADLNDVVRVIAGMHSLSDLSYEFRKLAHLIAHLAAVKRHIDREDDVIFPSLRKYGRISLCRAMQADHVNIKNEIDNLASLLVLFNEVKFRQFRAGLVAATKRLGTIAQEHLSQEDEILFPIALGMAGDPHLWQRMKALSDELGYCAIHL